MPDNKTITLTKDEVDKALGTIKKIQEQTQFLAHLISNGICGETEASTHMSLLRFGHDDLAKILKTDVVSAELEKSYAMCREANAKIDALQKQLAENVSAEGAAEKLRGLAAWFATWYQLSGFHYMTVNHGPYGLAFDSSDEIEHAYADASDIRISDKVLGMNIQGLVPYAFGGPGWDLRKDTFHDCLLDTDGNRSKLMELLASAFPNARIHAFKSHLDGKEYMLRMSGTVPWQDIQDWHDKLSALAEERASRNNGRYYARIAEIRMALASSRWKKENGEAAKELRAELKSLKIITDAWDMICDIKTDDSGKLLDDAVINLGPDETHTFKKGRKLAAVSEWLADKFGLDICRDLIGTGRPSKGIVIKR